MLTNKEVSCAFWYNPLTEKHYSMRMFSRLSLLVFLCLMFAISFAATSNCTGGDNIQPQPQTVKQTMMQLIIKFRDVNFDPAQGDYLQKLSRDIKATLVYLRPMSGGAHVFRVMDISDNA